VAEFGAALGFLGLLSMVTKLAFSSAAMKGGAVLSVVGLAWIACGLAALNPSRASDESSAFWQTFGGGMEMLPPPCRTMVGGLLVALGAALMVVSVLWLYRGPIPALARLSQDILRVSNAIMAVALVFIAVGLLWRKVDHRTSRSS
jgi:hypothetical protein